MFQAMWVCRTFSTMVELKTVQINKKAARDKQKKAQQKTSRETGHKWTYPSGGGNMWHSH